MEEKSVMRRLLKRNQSLIIAIGITVALSLWLLSGTGATGSARDPIAVGGPSTQWWTQLATAVAGGLAFATLLTLVLTPSLLVLGERLKFARRRPAQAHLPEATSTP
jgi:hypothetical protein